MHFQYFCYMQTNKYISYTRDKPVIHNFSVTFIVIWKLMIHSDPETPILKWSVSLRSCWISPWVSVCLQVCEIELWPLIEWWEGVMNPCRLQSITVPTTTHRRLSMIYSHTPHSTLPHSWIPKNLWVVFLATVCFVTGYKQQCFLGRESVLIENFQKRKTGIC